MSVNNCLLDFFPVEIFHLIFDYFSTIDIIRGFLKISSYIDNIILNSNFYKINFESILKSDFDLICNYINGNKIKCLRLSDGNDTPNQSNLFFSLFKMEEFSFNLNDLSLININDQTMELILNNFDKLNNLSSLTIRNNQLRCSSMLKNILPQLNRLTISNLDLFQNLIEMTKLKDLILLNSCSFNQFQMLINHCPNLISLNICLSRENGENISGINSNLTRLVLNMSSFEMNLIKMKELLNCFHYLIDLEIECRSDLDLCDGYQWQLFILDKLPYLKKFYFKFQLKKLTIILNSIGIENILRSFSTSFWLNEKRWFIAIEWGQRLIYSVPRFSCESADVDFRPPNCSTSLDDSIYYDNINALAVWGESNARFKNVKELWLVDNPSKINLNLIIDINRVERLIFVSSRNNLSIEILIDLISEMKNLNFIKFYSFPLLFNQSKEKICFGQIRSIELMRELKSFSSIEILKKVFPQIERLQMKIKSNEDIHHILNSFSNSLSIVQFYFETSNITITEKSIEKTLGHHNFTFSNHTDSIRLWIGSNNSKRQSHFEEERKVGCFSWCSSRIFLVKR